MLSKPLASIGLAFAILGGLTAAFPADPPQRRPEGARGGPYKVIAADFTGDKIIDLAVAYTADALTLERMEGEEYLSDSFLLRLTMTATGPVDARALLATAACVTLIAELEDFRPDVG